MTGAARRGGAKLPGRLTRAALLKQVLDTSPDAMLVVRSNGIVAFANSQAEILFGYSRDELEGSNIDELVPAGMRGKHAVHRADYHDSPHVRSMGANLDIYALRKDGSEFPAEISLSYLDTDDGLLISTAIRDATDRKERERALDERLRFEQLISHIASTLNEPISEALDTGINDALRRIGHFFGMNRCYLNQVSMDEAGFRVTHMWHADDSVQEELIKRLELGRKFPWFAKKILARESIFVSRLEDLPPEADEERQYCLDAGLASFATVPLVVEETILGNLGITHSAPVTWSESVSPRLELLCSIFANALARRQRVEELRDAFKEVEQLRDRLEVENLRLEKEIVEHKATESSLAQSEKQVRAMAGKVVLAQEEERRRVARELHDDVNQRLAMLAVGVGMLVQRAPDTRELTSEKLNEVKQKLVDLSNDVRRVSHRLHPSELEHLGLVQALRSECTELNKRQEGIEVELDVQSEPESIPWDVAVCLYRVAQESLRNAHKHSEAKKVRVTLAESADGVQISVTDDGTGFDVEASRRKGGLGLTSMEERVNLLRGQFSIQAGPGRGTELTAWIPISVERPSASETL